MKKLFLFILLALVYFRLEVSAQNVRMFQYTTDITGGCQYPYLAQNITSGKLFYCQQSSWSSDFVMGDIVGDSLTVDGWITISGNLTTVSNSVLYLASGNLVLNSGNLSVSGTAGVGIAQTDGVVHIHTATAGAVVASANADELVLENSTHVGAHFLAPDASNSQVYFGSPSNSIGGILRWNFDALTLSLETNAAGASTVLKSGSNITAVTLGSSQDATFAASLSVPATEHISLDGVMATGTYIREVSDGNIQLVTNDIDTFRTGVAGTIFNESGGDVDFRVEADNQINAIVMDAGLFSGSGAMSFGSAISTASSFKVGHAPGTLGAGTNYYRVLFEAAGAVTTASSSVHGLIASVLIPEPSITIGTAAVTVATNLYVAGAPTEGVTNAGAYFSGTNAILFDDNVSKIGDATHRIATIAVGTSIVNDGTYSGAPLAVTGASGGVAVAVTSTVVHITTNGDSDEDALTLVDGVDGQLMYFSVIAVGNASDSVKITPASMIGGTKITFAANPLGLGCIMQYDAGADGWTVVGNNGGTIS